MKYLLIALFFLPSIAFGALDDNLEGYWKLNESSGNAADSAPANNTMTNNNTIPFVAAKLGNGGDLELTGTQQWFSKTDTANLSITGSISICAWVNQETAGANYIVGHDNFGGVASRGYLFYIDAADKLTFFLSADATGVTTGSAGSTASVGTAAYKFLCGIYNGSTIKTYINGTEDGSVAYTSGIFNSANSIFIGAASQLPDTPFALPFDGVIDNVCVWSRAITTTEVTNLYNGGTGIECIPAAAATADLTHLLMLFMYAPTREIYVV